MKRSPAERSSPFIARLRNAASLLIVFVSTAACERIDPSVAAAKADLSRDRPSGLVEIHEALEFDSAFTLEENDTTINVVVRTEMDPHGGFLVADEQEGFVRRYARDGSLLAQFGGKGHGPGEFPNVLIALRLEDGTIVAFDLSHTAAVFDSTGARVLRTFRTPVAPLHAAMVLDDTLVLLGGQIRGVERDHRLHLWNLATDSLVASFFSPSMPSRAHEVAAASAGWVGFDRRGDTLAVVTSLSDTVYLTTLAGEVLDRIPIPSTALRRLDPRMELPTGRGGLAEARRWIGSFSLIADVHWIGDTFVVQYQDRIRPQPDWRLVGMTRDGRRTFESVDTPDLLASDSDEEVLYVVSPGADAPNVWRRARLRE